MYDEGLEPVVKPEGPLLQPASIGALRSEDHGLEIVPAESLHQNQYPQVLFGREEKEVCSIENIFSETHGVLLSSPTLHQRSKRRWWWTAGIFAVMVIAGIVLGTVEGLQHKRGAGKETPATASASNSSSTSNLTTSVLSTTGAFNGTALSMVPPDQVFDQIFVYFQHFSGDIRYAQLLDSEWSGGENAQTVVPSNVKNRTPLAGVSTHTGNVWTTYLFYVDSAGIVQSVSQSNASDGNRNWLAGNIGRLNIRVSDSPKAAFDACGNAFWYGSNVGQSGGIRFYVGEQDGLVHEYLWDQNSNTWSTGHVIPNSNGNGGAACWSGELTYLYMQNADWELQMFWNDLNPHAINTTTHALGIWNPGPIATGIDIRPNSSLAMSYYVYYQDSKDQIFGIYPNASAEASSWRIPFQVGTGPAMPGTAIECQTFYPSNDSPSGIYVFFQTNASDVVVHVRQQYGGPWSNNFVPVG